VSRTAVAAPFHATQQSRMLTAPVLASRFGDDRVSPGAGAPPTVTRALALGPKAGAWRPAFRALQNGSLVPCASLVWTGGAR
jgi:hypothetical protein